MTIAVAPPRVPVRERVRAATASEVAQSFDLLKLCGSSSEKAADFEEHEVCATLLLLLILGGALHHLLRTLPVDRQQANSA